jgi:hypothetical protein
MDGRLPKKKRLDARTNYCIILAIAAIDEF